MFVYLYCSINQTNDMATLAQLKKEVYDLAVFNSSLPKGYCIQLTEQDHKNYQYKQTKLKQLVDTAKKISFPVLYDGRSNVVYFIFGEVQISFHTCGGYTNESFGLPHTIVKWDGVTKAHQYTEAEYIALRDQRKIEIEKRKQIKAEFENQLVSIAKAEVEQLKKSLSRAKSEKRIDELTREISKLEKEMKHGYSLFERYKYSVDGLSEKGHEIYCDSYIHHYTV